MISIRVARRFQAALLSLKWFKAQKDVLKAVLKEPLKDNPPAWNWVIREKVLPFFDRFQKEFEELVTLDTARDSIQGRVGMAKDYLEAVAKKYDDWDTGYVNFKDPKAYLTWYARQQVLDKMKEATPTVGDILKSEWTIDKTGLEHLVQKTLNTAKPEEMAALTSDSGYRVKYEFLHRVGFEKAALRLVKRSKLDWDANKWVDRIYEMLAANYSEQAIQEAGGFREFDLHGMKVVVDDRTVDADLIKKYVRYLTEAYVKLKNKGFEKAWYGNVFIQCNDCGGLNSNTGGGTGGWYEIGRDTVTIFNRPGAFIVELMVHELGHRYWFKQMGSSQRAKFEALVKTHTKPRPLKPTVNVRMFKDKDIDDSKRQVLRAQERAEQRLARVVNYDLANLTSLARDNVGKDGWAFGGDILDAVTSLDVDKDLGSEVDRLKDDVYKTKTKLVEHFEDFTLLRPEGKDDWLAEARQLIDQVVSEALIFIDFAVQKHNERAKEKLKSDPAMLEWLDSYEKNPAPVTPVSTYGASNVDEAFAEVFAHYVLEFDMTRDQVESFRSVLSSMAERIVRRFNQEAVADRQANVVPFKPKTPTGPTLVIGGRKYALSNYWSMMEGLEDASDGARLILPEEPTNKFRYLWAFDTDKRVLGMWRVSDGDEKAFGRENQHSRDIVVLEKRKQLNRVTTEEFRTIERFMRGRQDDALASMKKYLEENADEWDRESKRLVEEFFKKSIEPKILAKFREIDQGVIPFGFKPNESHRPPLEAAKMHVAMAIFGKEFTLKAVDDFVRTKGIDPDNPPGDIQALDWARHDVMDAFYEAHFPHVESD